MLYYSLEISTCSLLTYLIKQLGGLKEHFLDDFAARFQAEGFAVLLYDNRCWGASDGLPRQETDPWKQVEDIHAAVSHSMTLPGVDPDRVVIWGSSYSGGNCMIAAAIDPRVKAVISQGPFTSGGAFYSHFPKELIDSLYANRVYGAPLEYARLFAETLEEVKTDGARLLLGTEESALYYQVVSKRKLTPGVEWKNEVTLQTIYHLIKHEPGNFIHRIAPRPLLVVIGLKDSILPAALAKAVYAKAGEGKEMLELDCGHFDAYHGEVFEINIKAQIEFLKKHML